MRTQLGLLRIFLASMLFSSFLVSCYAVDPGFSIKHLGGTQSIVYIDKPAKYLLLPVEESSGESKIFIVVDNDVLKTFNVRLAVDHVDYFVPVELDGYKGKNIALTVQMATDDALCWKEMKLSDTYDTANCEKFRPVYRVDERSERDGLQRWCVPFILSA